MPETRKIVFSKTFERAYKKYVGNNSRLRDSIDDALRKLAFDIFEPSLKTHKLGGKLSIYLSCSCGYDCRIVFRLQKDIDDPRYENIVLVDVGNHDDVY